MNELKEFDNVSNQSFNEERGGGGEEEAQDKSVLCPEDEEEESSESNNHNGESLPKMPLLKYGRVNIDPIASRESSSSSSFSVPCKCSALGRVVLPPTSSRILDSTRLGVTLDSTVPSVQGTRTFSVLALALEDGSIHLIDARNGERICKNDELKVKTDGSRVDVVSMCFDSGASYLGVLTVDGDVAVFELKYGLVASTTSSMTSGSTGGSRNTNMLGGDTRDALGITSQIQERPEKKLFDNFLSRLAGDDRSSRGGGSSMGMGMGIMLGDTNLGNGDRAQELPRMTMTGGTQVHDSNNSGTTSDVTTFSLCLIQPVSIARFTYKTHGSNMIATCLAIDPAYRRKKEKGLVVGFSNGRLIYTKRSAHGGVTADDRGFGGVMGSLLQPKRHDLDLYQSVGVNGIEAVAWRGSLLSWADESGVKIFDIEKLSRIAHIDRPSGARASLYPHISSLSPTLVFERSDSLLICWGDCLMNMAIVNSRSGLGDSEVNGKTGTRMTVRCEMAWEMDCVGCGVQPIDNEFVAVLGLSSFASHDDLEDEEENDLNVSDPMGQYLVELQIIKRSDGSMISSDVLPLAVNDLSKTTKPSTKDFALSSSFCTPRMEDTVEADGEDAVVEGSTEVDIQNIIMNTMVSSIKEEQPKNVFTDQHMRWNLDAYRRAIFDDYYQDDAEEESCASSACSEDSDDYTFLFRPNKTTPCSTKMLTNIPTMIVRSRDDLVLAQFRDVDDAIDHAQLTMKYGLVLRYGLNHRQMLRRHSLDAIIEDYLNAVLNPSETLEDYESPRLLSIRRMNIAAKAAPILIGGNIRSWERWVNEFSMIPGGLLVLRPHVPVRDPKLSPQIYNSFLQKMFSEISEMLSKETTVSNPDITFIHSNAVDLFLAAIRAWGTSSSLRDRIKLHQRFLEDNTVRSKKSEEQIRLLCEAEVALANRMRQSATVYLQFDSLTAQETIGDSEYASSSLLHPTGPTYDCLFDLRTIQTFFITELDKINSSKDGMRFHRTKLAILETLSDLYFIEGDTRNALLSYLVVGSEYAIEILDEMSNTALQQVLKHDFRVFPDSKFHCRFSHVLTFIQSEELHKLLIDPDVIGRQEVPPIMSLICLVGLQNAGSFIVNHCILPESKGYSTKVGNGAVWFPIDMVANQLNNYPKLLLWLLHNILINRPEIYVNFPNTAVPPTAVTKLHKAHFDLLVTFDDQSYFPDRRLADIPSFEELKKESSMLMFLKAALPHGGIRSDDVRKTLEWHRHGKKEVSEKDESSNFKVLFPRLFAHELAYVIERSGKGSEEDSKRVLLLYLEGVVSLPHAVEYAERNLPHSSMLWDSLVSFCLDPNQSGENGSSSLDGKLFGSLMEVAARSGANLAHLVSKIPKNMRIDGIRHRLVAAISDYQTKLKLHENAFQIMSDDKIDLLREHCHRSRRGTRVDLYSSTQAFIPDKERDDDAIQIVLKPWKEGKVRLASKRKMRQNRNIGIVKSYYEIGMGLPSSLEIQ